MITRPKLQALDAAEVPAEALAAFFREVWDQRATAESVSRGRREGAVTNLAQPGVEVPTAAVLVDDRVVGYCSSLPIEIWDGGAAHPAYWVKGLMVLPEYRNGPIGYLVLKELVGRLPRSLALMVAPASVRLFEALGYRSLGTVPNYVYILRPGRLASKAPTECLERRLPRVLTSAVRWAQRTGLLGVGVASIGLGLRAVTGVHAVSHLGLTVNHSAQPPSLADLDRLWLHVRHSPWSGVLRNARYLSHRYREARYHFVTVRDRGGLRALAVLRAPREQSDDRVRGLSLGTLSDLVVRRGDWWVALAATRAATVLARRLGGDALLASGSSRWIGRVLVSQAWLPVPGNLQFLVRDLDPSRRWPSDLRHWWLMRGDGESDGAL